MVHLDPKEDVNWDCLVESNPCLWCLEPVGVGCVLLLLAGVDFGLVASSRTLRLC